jgi:hypothetical protein
MPLLRDPDGVLNDLNRAKAKINKNNKRNVKGSETAVISGSTKETTELFEALVKKLVDLRVAIYEVSTTLDLVVLPEEGVKEDKKKEKERIDRTTVADIFLKETSALIRQTTDLDQFTTRKLKNNLNQFSPDQFAEIDSVFSQISDNWAVFQIGIGEAQQSKKVYLQLIGDKISELVEEWEPVFVNWLEKFDNLSKAYGKGGSDPERDVSDFLGEEWEGAGFGFRPSHYEPTYKIGDQKTYGPRRYL